MAVSMRVSWCLALLLLSCNLVCLSNASAELETRSGRHLAEVSRKWLQRPDQDVLVVGLLDGRVVAVDSTSGSVLWTFDSGAPLLSVQQSEGTPAGTHIFPGVDGALYAYHGVAGNKAKLERLPITLPELVDASPSLTDDGSLIVGQRMSSVFMLDTMSGQPLRVLTGNLEDKAAAAMRLLMPEAGHAIVLGREDYTVRSMHIGSGVEAWNATFSRFMRLSPGQAAATAAAAAAVGSAAPGLGQGPGVAPLPPLPRFTVSADNSLQAYDAETGYRLWSVEFDAPPVAAFSALHQGLNHLDPAAVISAGGAAVPGAPGPPSSSLPAPPGTSPLVPQGQGHAMGVVVKVPGELQTMAVGGGGGVPGTRVLVGALNGIPYVLPADHLLIDEQTILALQVPPMGPGQGQCASGLGGPGGANVPALPGAGQGPGPDMGQCAPNGDVSPLPAAPHALAPLDASPGGQGGPGQVLSLMREDGGTAGLSGRLVCPPGLHLITDPSPASAQLPWLPSNASRPGREGPVGPPAPAPALPAPPGRRLPLAVRLAGLAVLVVALVAVGWFASRAHSHAAGVPVAVKAPPGAQQPQLQAGDGAPAGAAAAEASAVATAATAATNAATNATAELSAAAADPTAGSVAGAPQSPLRAAANGGKSGSGSISASPLPSAKKRSKKTGKEAGGAGGTGGVAHGGLVSGATSDSSSHGGSHGLGVAGASGGDGEDAPAGGTAAAGAGSETKGSDGSGAVVSGNGTGSSNGASSRARNGKASGGGKPPVAPGANSGVGSPDPAPPRGAEVDPNGHVQEQVTSPSNDAGNHYNAPGPGSGANGGTGINGRYARLQPDGSLLIGRLRVGPGILGYGSAGTVVYEGVMDGRTVAVKRLLRQFYDLAKKEIEVLIMSDEHPNVVRCFAMEEDREFVYLALERCRSTLNELLGTPAGRAAMLEPPGAAGAGLGAVGAAAPAPSARCLELMRQVAQGLAALHERSIVHRDLKPHNVLITDAGRAKLSDMGLSKQLVAEQSSFESHGAGGSSGWQAPEQLIARGGGAVRQTRAMDVFSLGCVLHYCLTGGVHPFGDSYARDGNILHHPPNLALLSSQPEAANLLAAMLLKEPSARPSMAAVLSHPLWWSADQRLQFLVDISDRVENEDREPDQTLLAALEAHAASGVGGNWGALVDPQLVANLGRYRRYDYTSLRDLLRVVRNKRSHFREMPQELQVMLGPLPGGFLRYFTSRFPGLLMAVYAFGLSHLKEEVGLEQYWPCGVAACNPFLAMLAKTAKSAAARVPLSSLLSPVAMVAAAAPAVAMGPGPAGAGAGVAVGVGEPDPGSAGSRSSGGPGARGEEGGREAAPGPRERHGRRGGSWGTPSGTPSLNGSSGPAAAPAAAPDSPSHPTAAGAGAAQPSPPATPAAPAAVVVGYEVCDDSGTPVIVEFPQRPGKQTCEFFVKTGHCKYGDTCVFDHPSQHCVPRTAIGLPLRPEQPVCAFYLKNNDCKFGAACRFHHPMLKPIYAGSARGAATPGAAGAAGGA